MFDLKGKAKWDAWTSKKGAFGGWPARRTGGHVWLTPSPGAGLSKEEAMTQYVALAAELKLKYA